MVGDVWTDSQFMACKDEFYTTIDYTTVGGLIDMLSSNFLDSVLLCIVFEYYPGELPTLL